MNATSKIHLIKIDRCGYGFDDSAEDKNEPNCSGTWVMYHPGVSPSFE